MDKTGFHAKTPADDLSCNILECKPSTQWLTEVKKLYSNVDWTLFQSMFSAKFPHVTNLHRIRIAQISELLSDLDKSTKDFDKELEARKKEKLQQVRKRILEDFFIKLEDRVKLWEEKKLR